MTQETRIIMGMPITVAVVADDVSLVLDEIFAYFVSIDSVFSTYKPTSEISRINDGFLLPEAYSEDMQTIFRLSEQTKRETRGYFSIFHHGRYDPSGIVKGWAIYQASQLLSRRGFRNFYIEAGGDVQVSGRNQDNTLWSVGIRNPFQRSEFVKKVYLSDCGIATSGTYIRGQHIYNPHAPDVPLTEIMSMTVIGSNVYEADRFATAAFAMGREGIVFIEQLSGFEAYMIDRDGVATYTSGFDRYLSSVA